MRTLTYQLRDLKKVTIEIGFEGENNRTQVRIDCGEVFAEYPNAEAALKVQAPKGGIYPATVTRDGNMILWTVRDCDVANKGNGEFQLTFTDGETVVKTCPGKIHIDRSLKGSGTAPSGVQDWLERAEDALEQVESAEIHQPMIGLDGYWYKWDQEAKEYVSTGTKARGEDGDPGQPGTDATPDLITVPYEDLTFPVAAGTKCYHGGKLYEANQAIQTSEQWTAAHWTETTVEEQLNTVKSALTSLNTNAVQYVGSRTFHVGENLLTDETTFSGTGWSGSLANGFTHATGNTDPLVFAAETVNGQAYIIDYDFTGDIGGDNMFVAIGDMPKVDVYHGAIRPFVGIISDGGYLKIYCKSTYTGTITNLKIRPVLESGGTELTFECAEITNGQNPKEISSWHVVAIGRDVLSKNVNGTRTVAIGDRALEKIVTGHRNIAIGPYAMPFVTEGDCNVSIGADTLYNPSYNTGESKAYGNVAIGKGTMRNGELVQNNIAIGQGAMSMNDVNAEENVCVGRQAGYNTKKRNTFIGHRAGYYYTGDAGINNVCVGADAGFNAYHNGQGNVFIGAEARANVPGASASTQKTCNNSIAIGKGVKVTGSYQIVIGNQYHETVIIAGKTIKFNEDGTVTWE